MFAGRVVTGNYEVSCSQYLRPIGLPLNPMECGKFRKLKILTGRIFRYMKVCIRHAAASLAARAQETADEAGEMFLASATRCCEILHEGIAALA